MRRAARVDANQPDITKALRQIGATVVCIHGFGQGLGDLLVGFRGRNWLLEVKDGSKPPSARKLTKDELEFHQAWAGQINTVCSIEEALGMLLGSRG